MPKSANAKSSSKDSNSNLGYENKLWLAAHRGQDKWALRQSPFGLVKRSRRVRLLVQQPNQRSPTTRRLSIMELAIRGIEADFGKNHADIFRDVQPPDLRADHVLANPTFHDSDISLRGSAFRRCEAKTQVVSESSDNHRKLDDVRWQFGIPPQSNATFARLRPVIHHLAQQLASFKQC